MNRRIGTLIGLGAAAFVMAAPLSFAQEQPKPPMHMHKSEMDHRPDKDVATEYKTEASELHAKAESHRKLAKLYETRTAPKGGADYKSVAKHCEKLAKFYDDAAKEAEGVAAELAR
jgi:hypothetical protein